MSSNCNKGVFVLINILYICATHKHARIKMKCIDYYLSECWKCHIKYCVILYYIIILYLYISLHVIKHVTVPQLYAICILQRTNTLLHASTTSSSGAIHYHGGGMCLTLILLIFLFFKNVVIAGIFFSPVLVGVTRALPC
jgi:hypothetical protein